MPEPFAKKYGTDIAGAQYECAVQDLFTQLTGRKLHVYKFSRSLGEITF